MSSKTFTVDGPWVKLLSLIIWVFLSSWMVSLLWNWQLVPAFDLPRLEFLPALAIRWVVRFLVGHQRKD